MSCRVGRYFWHGGFCRRLWLLLKKLAVALPEVCHQVDERMPRDLQVEFGGG